MAKSVILAVELRPTKNPSKLHELVKSIDDRSLKQCKELFCREED
jgi:hypothetical protein